MSERAKKAVGGIITVEENVIMYKDTIICADNISTINLCKSPKTSYKTCFGLFILSIYLIVESGLNLIMVAFSIISLIIGLIAFFVVLIKNSTRPMTMTISTNDSNIFYFTSHDMGFLNNAMNAVIDCIAEGRRGKVTINLENSTITNSSIGNTVSHLKN